MYGINEILCKTGPQPFQILTHKCNIINKVCCEAKRNQTTYFCVSKGCDFLFCNDLDFDLLGCIEFTAMVTAVSLKAS